MFSTRIIPRTTRFRTPLVSHRYQSTVAPTTPAGKTLGPLSGIRVLDMTRVLAGPFCTMLLGDLGAEVIKVEHPARGDDTRAWGPPFKLYEKEVAAIEGSAYYLCANRNKQSIAVDMKIKEGRQVILDLAKESDVFVENYVPGKLAEYGLGYEDLKRVNPKLIYASITGYGSFGPYANKPGYDTIIEAEAGLMHITGEANGPPVKVGVAVTDVTTGIYAHSAILAALLSRVKSNVGQHLDVSLMQTQATVLANIASSYLIGGKEGSRLGSSHPSIVPYQVFPTKDGSICIGAGNDKQYKIFTDAINRPDLLENPKYATNADRVQNRDELVALITEALSIWKTDDLVSKLEGSGMPFGPVNNIKQTFEHPQLVARKVVKEVEHPFAGTLKLVGPAVEYSSSHVGVRLPPPMLGQHTEQVLRSILNYSDEQLETTVRSGGAVLYDYNLPAQDAFDLPSQ
ncbi:CoA-transferase family III [Linderina pennispora]|uniref:CoA-transferase family III n=1 Tax=Linderina pennispora TaxID=61395 RepID=A0A1Y1WGV7_9FUNG|nr:CoA-transferase family III [Linderina pennispora]ORX72763.1 CoA-transferase family III [Linderina pennispora]